MSCSRQVAPETQTGYSTTARLSLGDFSAGEPPAQNALRVSLIIIARPRTTLPTCPSSPARRRSDEQPCPVRAGSIGDQERAKVPTVGFLYVRYSELHTQRRAPAFEYRVVRPPPPAPPSAAGANARTGPDIRSGPLRAADPRRSSNANDSERAISRAPKRRRRGAPQNAGTGAFAIVAAVLELWAWLTRRSSPGSWSGEHCRGGAGGVGVRLTVMIRSACLLRFANAEPCSRSPWSTGMTRGWFWVMPRCELR